MSLIKPFRGLRPPAQWVKEVAAPPYDVVDTKEARAYAKGKARCFFHVSRPEIDLPVEVDEHADAVYARGAENLKAFIDQKWLVPDARERLYLYRQRMGNHVQTGLVACASVAEYDKGTIKKHELTRADKEDDRTRHIAELGAHDEPVFLTYRADPTIDALVANLTQGVPEYEFVSEDSIGHTFWLVPEASTDKLVEAFARIPNLYIADGHHRSAAASRLAASTGRGTVGETGFFLTVIFPHNQMQILDYNRVVKDLNGLTVESFLERLREKFSVEPSAEKKPRAGQQFGMYLGGKWYALAAKQGSFANTPVGVLDVSILQNNLLGPVLGIGDPRLDKRIHFVGGIRGMAELERLVDSKAYAVAFSMFPTTLDQLMAIADAGEIMPPKSTWFEPKLRSGLVVHATQKLQ